MKRMQYIFGALVVSLLLTGCPTSKVNLQDKTEKESFKLAQQAIRDGAYKRAILILEDIENRYPYGSYDQQIQLDLIYTYYKTGDLLKAMTNIDRFIKLNPYHENIDYVYYLRGLINMAFDENMIQGLFGIDRSDRDPAYAYVAFKEFTNLVNQHPNSIYVADAQKRLVFLKNRLAKYELSIVKFYYRREAYIAVINRVKEMLTNFADAQQTREALPIMLRAYEKLGLKHEAEKTRELIKANPVHIKTENKN